MLQPQKTFAQAKCISSFFCSKMLKTIKEKLRKSIFLPENLSFETLKSRFFDEAKQLRCFMWDLLGGKTRAAKLRKKAPQFNLPKASTGGHFSDHGGLLQFSQKPQKPSLSASFCLLNFLNSKFLEIHKKTHHKCLKDSRCLDQVFRVSCGEDRHSPLSQRHFQFYCILISMRLHVVVGFCGFPKVSLCIQVLPLVY